MANIIDRLNRIHKIVASQYRADADFVRQVMQVPVERFFLIEQAVKLFSKEMFLYLDELGVFDFDNIPRKTENGFYGWDAGFLLRRASEVNKEQFDLDINNVLLRIINQYIDYSFERKGDAERNFLPDWLFADCILSLRLNDISDKHITFIRDIALHSHMAHVDSDLTGRFFKRILEERDDRLLYILLGIIYNVRAEEGISSFELKSEIDGFVLREFADNSSDALLSVFGPGVIPWLINRVEELDERYPSSFGKFLIVSIAEDEQNNWQRDSLSQSIVRQLRDLLENSLLTKVDREDFVKVLLKNKHEILQRIAIYIIDRFYDSLQQLFWEIPNPMLQREWKLEVHKLIRAHAQQFTDEQMQTLLDFIQAIPAEEPYDKYSSDDMQRFNNSRKIEWLQAFDGLTGERKKRIEEEIYNLKSKGGVESNFAGYDSYSRFTVGGDYDQSRIISQDLGQVAERISDPQQWNGYDQFGLQQDLRQLVTNRSDEVVRKLDKFASVPPAFLYYIFDALRELLQKGTSVDRGKIFAFTRSLLSSRADIWNPEDPQNESGSMLGMICWMLRDAADKEVLTLSEMATGVDILIMIDERFTKPFHYLNREKDKNFDIINSTRGKLYDALIHLSMKLAKPKEKTQEEKWHPHIRDVFEKRLNDGSFYDEFYWTAGMYTPQLSYLDHNWWMGRLEALYVINGQIQDYAFQAYLMYTRTLYGNIFAALQPYYYRSLERYIEKSVITDRLTEHALIAYLYHMNGAEDFLKAIFALRNIGYLSHMVSFIDRRNLPLLKDDELVELWKRILQAAEEIGGDMASALIYQTAEFTESLVEFTDESTALFVSAAAHYQSTPYIHRFIEKIISKAPEQPDLVGVMLEALLMQVKGDFSYNQTKIVEVLQILYEKGQAERADRIVLHLAEQGNFYVRELYNKIHGV